MSARTPDQIQRDGADILVLKYLLAALDNGETTRGFIADLELHHGAPPGAIDRILQRIDALQRKADAFDHLVALARMDGRR